MRDNATATTGRPRALRRRSLARRAWCDADLPRELTDAILRGDLGQVLFSSEPLQVKDRCVVARHESPGGPLLVKRHMWGGAWRTFRMAFREPAARSCARLGRYLHDHGIPTPRPRGYVDHRLGPWTYRSYLVSDYIEGESLYRYIRFGSQSTDELRHVAIQVAQIWQKLVELRISHNDMKPENFIVDRNFDVWLIDLERVRLRGKARRQRQRQVFDVQNFLHIRGWHHGPEARAIFAEAFLQTPYGEWLRAAGVERMAKMPADSDAQIDPELSVLIVCDGSVDMPLLRQAIDSVRDIADEVVLVEPTESGRLEVLKRIEVCGKPTAAKSAATKGGAKSPVAPVARYPWVLLLRQNECVSPFLAKEMQQRIADARSTNAWRIPLEPQFFGGAVVRHGVETPIRLYRQSACSLKAGNGDVNVLADAQRIGQLTGKIQSCTYATVGHLLDHLNEQTNKAAKSRLDAGEKAHLFRAALSAAGKFIVACVRRGGIRCGWTGFQIAAIESAFSWVEEVKLYQLAGQFRGTDTRDESAAENRSMRAGESAISVMPLTKAA